MNKIEFQNTIWNFYKNNKRYMPWRETITRYGVVVSEIMLQQTQVPRVLTKYPEFMEAFPTFDSLASASLEEVLRVWQGMGYNRRAKYLCQIAQIIISEHKGTVPRDLDVLDDMPGIGPATARSIVVFTYNTPEVFIETNIRRVFIHHFFKDAEEVSDTEIFPLVEKTVDRENPREWYYALMDYGTELKKRVKNPNRRSKHYTRQSKFEGSKRQVRGAILKSLLKEGPQKKKNIPKLLGFEKERVYNVLEEMKGEGFVMEEKGEYRIRK